MQASFLEFLRNSKNSKTVLFICSNDKIATQLSDVAKVCGRNPFVLPDFRAHYGEDLRSYQEELRELFTTLDAWYKSNDGSKILISPFRTISKKLPLEDRFDSFELSFAQKLNLSELKNKVYGWGYEFVDIVQTHGEVSFRGDIIDIFSPNHENPVRLSLFDTDIESIRFFDLSTQRSQKTELESIQITPSFLSLTSEEFEELESKAKKSDFDAFYGDVNSLGFWLLEKKTSYIEKYNAILIGDISQEIDEYFEESSGLIDKSELINLPLMPQAKLFKQHEIVNIKEALEFHKDKKITIIAKNEIVLKSAECDFSGHSIMICDSIVNLISDNELFLSLNRREKKKRLKKSNIVIDDLKIGDFVVHTNYGIGVFKGLKQVKALGAVKDFVEIAYQGEDRLLLPVENLSLVDRYVYDSGSIPVVDKLGKGSFVKLKESVRAKLFEIANDIVALAAKRELISGIKIGCKDPRLVTFSKSSGFEYTDDQQKSIHDIFIDIGSGKVMDRLLSGDVGFGKTEVAMNAAYAVGLSGYKTVITVPTAILSNQHFESFKERFDQFGFRVLRLDRFVSPKEKKETLKALESGNFEIVIGTHALLDVKTKNVALVVVDEEHKFGVKQKEKLKQFALNAHMLSMSATPIPRSLNMALSRVKSLSEIKTPPSERVGVRTFVKAHDDKIIKESIARELRRGGQIFYIHNRIADILEVQDALKALMPVLKIEILHSQISADETERIMIDFAHSKFDLLLSTSIVESGVNLPNANTIIIDGADHFGIADLHQLRGRVGRGRREGYAYFFVEEMEKVTEEAKKRLIALESNSYLGSGAALAYHDLEIRGGGNIVGEAQSGHIKNIGYSLYLKMLESAINELSGQVEDTASQFEMKLSISAYISPDYITEDRIRLELYRRLSGCKNSTEIYEIEEEMNDRFGKCDEFTSRFLDEMHIKTLALSKNIVSISNYTYNVTILYANNEKKFLSAESASDDDLLAEILKYLRK